jgi:hypothetical protein
VTKRFGLQSSLSVVDLWQAPFHKVGGDCHLTAASEQCQLVTDCTANFDDLSV